MAYRRRRNRGTWLPVAGTAIEEESDTYLSGIAVAVPIPATNAGSVVNIQAVTHDYPFEGDNTTDFTTMGEVLGNEYFLDRIVGKLFLSYVPTRDSTNGNRPVSGPLLVGAGFFVARADERDGKVPIGATGGDTSLEAINNYSPLDNDNVREPWIWRRTWVLGMANNTQGFWFSPAGQPEGQYLLGAYPASTALYGSVMDGPHIDAKTKRRIGQDDRLWLALSSSWIGGIAWGVGEGDLDAYCAGFLDLRLHGALRKARQSGKF